MKEEEKAIERIHDLIHTCEVGIEKHGEYDDLFLLDKQALETVLNLIETQKAEIKKRDMIIDRMTEYIMTHSSVPTLRHRFCPNYEKEECRIDCRDTIMKSKCIIEYFTKLVEEEK